MELHINGEKRRFSQSETINVSDLLDALAVEQRRGLAVAINERVIPKSRWSEFLVNDGDAVEIIRATQGG
ncbi:MAG: sulfur carrier protein ThiS [Bradymonadaceae bacterium]|nr:sulfur carrier protein ThiS [Lujinxingiaceae bacterium]